MTMMDNDPPVAAGKASVFLGAASALLGATVLFGWYSGAVILTKVNPAFLQMHYNTALGFLLCGAGLLAWGFGRPQIAAVLGIAVALIGLLALCASIFGIHTGLNELLLKLAHHPETSYPGRMAPNTVLCLILSGVGLTFGFLKKPTARINIAFATVGAIVMMLGIVTFFGHFINMEPAHDCEILTGMPLHTAAGFIVVGAGCLAHALQTSERRWWTAPGWLPIPVGIAGITVSIVLWQAISAHEARQLHIQTERARHDLQQMISNGLAVRGRALERMAERWALRGGTPRAEWEADARAYYEDQGGYQALAWVDSSLHVRWTVSREGNQATRDLALPYVNKRRAEFQAAATRREPTVTRTIDLAQGGKGFFCYVPIDLDGGFGGFIVGLFRVKELLDELLEHLGRGYELTIHEGNTEIYRRQSSSAGAPCKARADALDVSQYGAHWRLSAWPSAELVGRETTNIPLLTLLTGSLLSGFLAFSLHTARVSKMRHHQAEEASRRLSELNITLEHRIDERTADLVAQHRAVLNLARDAEDAKQQALQVSEALKRSNEELEQFAYVASHDLQEPLRMVASYTALLAERYQGKLDERADKYIYYAVDGARRMQELINDLLALSRVGTRAKPPEPVPASDVLDQVLANMQAALRETNGQVSRSELPVIPADRIQLGQLFQNLISNALKFRGEAPPQIQVTAERSADAWVFCVRDNGIGLDMQFAERIFQVFQRLHGRGEYPGSGIGLAISKKIVERHGGRIWVESEPGKGAAFFFTWPFEVVAHDAQIEVQQ